MRLALCLLIQDIHAGQTIFYDFYSDEQKQKDPAKEHTGLFFYRGNPDAPFAIVAPGGGFSYVGSLHEGFPIAQRISELGLNAFVIRYRIGSEQQATEDLAAAITYIFQNAEGRAWIWTGYRNRRGRVGGSGCSILAKINDGVNFFFSAPLRY